MSSLLSSNTGSQAGRASLTQYSSNYDRIGQGIITGGDNVVLSSVKFILAKYGAVTGIIYAKVWSGQPPQNNESDLLAISDGIDVSTLSTNDGEKEFIFSGANQITLNANTVYTIGLSFDSGVFGKGVYVTYTSDLVGYAMYVRYYNTGSWANTSNDLYYLLYVSPVSIAHTKEFTDTLSFRYRITL